MNKMFKLAYSLDIAFFDGIQRLKPIEEIANYFRNLKLAQIDNIMIGGIHLEEKTDFDFKSACHTIRELLDQFEINVTSFHSWLPTMSLIADNRNEIEDKVIKTLEFSSILKPSALVLHPLLAGKNAPFSDYFLAKERHGQQTVINNVADNVRFIGQQACQYNMKVALENTGYLTPLGNIRYLPELVNIIDLDNVGYCLDTGHANAFGEDVSEWITLIGEKLFETHFNDNQGKGACLINGQKVIEATKEIDEHLPVGFGTINWIDVINNLRKIKFSYPITFETTGWPVGNELEGLKLAVKWWRTCESIASEKLNIGK
jgi:sugar phosphate isomerase/epimerase